jgi:uncharacterized cofD-like protein
MRREDHELRSALSRTPPPMLREIRVPLRVVAVGGGTGLPAVLGGLTRPRGTQVAVQVSAVVTTSDDGGSSGKLRRQYGLPSPGDIRNCLVALTPRKNPLARIFQHRFPGNGGLGGHTVGNLVLAALAQRLGDFGAAVDAATRLLGAQGRVLPSTAQRVDVVAELSDGRVVRGETAIAAARGRIARLRLRRPVRASRTALDAVAAADLVVFGPGSLYTSVIASLLGEGMGAALAACGGWRVLVVNLFTQPGETDGYDAADHVRAIQQHFGPVIDAALVHSGPLPQRMVSAYADNGARVVACNRDALAALGVRTFEADLLAAGSMSRARHDPGKLGKALHDIVRSRRKWLRGEKRCAESSVTLAGTKRDRSSSRASGVSSIEGTTARARLFSCRTG